MNRRLSFVILLFLQTVLSFEANAFMNIEALRQVPGYGFVGESSLKVAGQKGNTNKFSVNTGTMNMWRWDRDDLMLLADYIYAYTNQRRDTNNGRFHARYTFDSREIFSYETYMQTEFDEFKYLNIRHLAGANVRQIAGENESVTLVLGYGMFYEVENYNVSGTRDGLRGNFYVSLSNKLNEIITGSMILYYQPSLRQNDDYRIRLTSGLDVRLTDRLSIDLDLNINHDNWLPVDIVKTDMTYFAGFSVRY